MKSHQINKAALCYYVRSGLRAIGQNADVRETEDGIAVPELDFFVRQDNGVLKVFSGVTSLHADEKGNATSSYREEMITTVLCDDLPVAARAIALNMAGFIIDSNMQTAFDALSAFHERKGRDIQSIDEIAELVAV